MASGPRSIPIPEARGVLDPLARPSNDLPDEVRPSRAHERRGGYRDALDRWLTDLPCLADPPAGPFRVGVPALRPDIYLGWAEAQTPAGYSEDCLYPLIPWMNTTPKRSRIVQVWGNNATVPGPPLAGLMPWLGAFKTELTNLGQPITSARELATPVHFARLRVRDGWLALFGGPAGAPVPGGVAVLGILTGGANAVIDLAVVGQVQAWVADARAATFEEDLRPTDLRP